MKESLYDRLKAENLSQLNTRSKRFPNMGAKVEKTLRDKRWVLELTVGDLDDMNGMLSDHQNIITNINVFDIFNKNEK